ncbi:MAG TPA: glycosyltransferase family 2 protein, partial [Chthoniobacterales bacterium]|nr:glycosyltransferase family 2 protein [Chthoniobacterales bacterium]
MNASCAYLLPLRRKEFNPGEARQIAEYLKQLGEWNCEVLVIDGSTPPVFEQHYALWKRVCRHVPVDRRFGYPNDKVNGVHTGIDLTDCEKIVLADDDIRYSKSEIVAVTELLERFDLVRPQNYLSPLPWWGRTEAARMLINRAVLRTADYPGTCGFRRSTMRRVGHYDGDVLFDNEELIRHFASSGATIAYANDLFVRKRPPSFRKWIEQRPRQAYEDFGLRLKTLL